MADNETLIPCEVSPGQFESEYSITLHVNGGRIISLFADKGLVQCHNDKTYLKVTRIHSGQEKKEEGEIVVLPTEAFENGSRWLRKTGDQLVAA